MSRLLGLELGPADAAQRNKRALLAFLLATLAVGALASVFIEPDLSGRYLSLLRPAWAPPDWLIAPLLTGAYVLMAVAAWRVWRVAGLRNAAMALYAAQLALWFAWSLALFAAYRLEAAFVLSLLFCAVGAATGLAFLRREKAAALIYLPVLGTGACGAWLNLALWRMNAT